MSSTLDFGFRKLKCITDFTTDTKPIYDNQVYKKDENGKFKTNKILRLRCNDLQKLDGLDVQLSESITNFSAIQWLDLSFNEITAIGKNLEILPELKLLYLHGNSIANIKEVNNLKCLTNLNSLTLHGNPLEQKHNYRKHILSVLPQLIKFDFSLVTKAEKREIAPPFVTPNYTVPK